MTSIFKIENPPKRRYCHTTSNIWYTGLVLCAIDPYKKQGSIVFLIPIKWRSFLPVVHQEVLFIIIKKKEQKHIDDKWTNTLHNHKHPRTLEYAFNDKFASQVILLAQHLIGSKHDKHLKSSNHAFSNWFWKDSKD